MTFSDFQRYREDLLRNRPGVIDCAETNLYAALSKEIPPPTEEPPHRLHRCHLAADWVRHFDLSPDLARCALVSTGVRNSLALLFRHYAALGARVWLPEDNYPVYGQLARAAGLSPLEFPTIPTPHWPATAPGPTSEILVVTNPLKPLGRWLEEEEANALRRWLSKNPSRRLLLDVVYTFDVRFHPTTLGLFSTRQTILLHSVTKGWLNPKLFGTALVPEQDVATLAPVFRAEPPPQLNLARAKSLFTEYAELPYLISRRLEAASRSLRAAVQPSIIAENPPATPTYFHLSAQPWERLLQEANVLGIPASVFGSSNGNATFLSSLRFL